MSTDEYLHFLRNELSQLPRAELDSILSFYTQKFEQSGTKRAQLLIDELGSPSELAQKILNRRTSRRKKESFCTQRSSSCSIWTLISTVFVAILTAPLTLPLIILLFVGFVVCIAISFAIGVTSLVLFLSGFGLFWSGAFSFLTSPGTALILIGTAFLLWGGARIVWILVRALCSLIGGSFLWMTGTKGGHYEQ